MGGMVWSGSEWYYGHVSFIDAGDESTAGEDMVCLTRIGVVVGEVGGEVFLTGVIFAIFEFGGGKMGNRIVRSGGVVL